MFAIIEIGGKQFRVEKGSQLTVEKVDSKEGNSFEIDKVLILSDGGKMTIGQPFVAGVQVKANVVSHFKGEKALIFKFKAKKRYQRKRGHRQDLTKIEITDIKTGVAKKETPKAETKATIPKAVKKAPATKKTPAKKKA
ncbi:MAG: 50S ribosomal protein L21 [Candidatus Gracilibacteria bacterium]